MVRSAFSRLGAAARSRSKPLWRALACTIAFCFITGCSGGDASSRTKPTGSTVPKANLDCRQQWGDLKKELPPEADQKWVSSLPQRLDSMKATIAYYQASARAEDCGMTLGNHRTAVTELRAFVVKLRRYDPAYTLNQLTPKVQQVLQASRSSIPKPQVRRALTTAQAQAPRAVADMRAGWGQLTSLDLANQAAVRKALADMDFLTTDSGPYKAAQQALRVLQKATAKKR